MTGTRFNRTKASMLLIAVVLIASTVAMLQVLRIDAKAPTDQPSLLRVGVLPDRNPEVLRKKYSHLVDYLAAQTGSEVRLIIPSDYFEALALFRDREVDLALFGGLTYVQAQAAYGAIPLVMREIDTRFSSWFLVRPDMANMDTEDFRGSSFSFGSKLSTSGHLMPRHFLQDQWQINPESFFSSVSYSGAHDKTALLVRDGHVDVGAVNAIVVRAMIDNGQLSEEEVHVIWQTPPYPNYVWTVQRDLPEAYINKLRDAFLSLDPTRPGNDALLTALNARTFLPADPLEYSFMAETADSLGMMEPALK